MFRPDVIPPRIAPEAIPTSFCKMCGGYTEGEPNGYACDCRPPAPRPFSSGVTVDLLARAEQLRQIQAECNAYERADGTGNFALAASWNAWGHLHKAMLDILAEWYYSQQGAPPSEARAMADRVLDEVYDNGEDLSWNMRLLATGEIELSPSNYVQP